MVLEYRDKIRERASAATANRHHSLLRSMLNKAIEWDKFSGPNPASRVKQERENNHRLRFLSEQEVCRLLSCCHPRIYPTVACALLTGMRKGEILALRWEHVDIANGIIYVLQSKSGKPREIPIATKLKIILSSLDTASDGLVFDLPEMTLRRAFALALRLAKISDFRFHDLRHTFASHFIMQTGDLPSLQRLLGHQSPMMTQRYAHLAENHLRSGIERLDKRMDTFWTPRPQNELGPVAPRLKIPYIVPTEIIQNGDVAQRLERAFHNRPLYCYFH